MVVKIIIVITHECDNERFRILKMTDIVHENSLASFDQDILTELFRDIGTISGDRFLVLSQPQDLVQASSGN